MRLLRRFSALPDALRGGSYAIGNFDGVHLGHRAVIEAARRSGKSPLGVLLFAPHPRLYFRPDDPLSCLTDLRAKLCLLERVGVEVSVIAPFDAKMANRSAEEFVQEVLHEQLGARHVAVGYDFAFGKKRQGNADALKHLGEERDISVDVVESVLWQGEACSSTRIRAALHRGELAAASEMLGHWWGMGGQVLQGAGRGREFGFPTANLLLEDSSLGAAFQLPFGIYAAWVFIEGEGKRYEAAVSLGERPMFDTPKPLLEAHLLDFEGDLYGRRIWVFPAAFLRGEEKFESIEALRAQMQSDCLQARRRLQEIHAPPCL